MLGNGERADGPWYPTYSQFVELRDGTSSSFRRTFRNIATTGPGPELVTVLTDSVVSNRIGARETGS